MKLKDFIDSYSFNTDLGTATIYKNAYHRWILTLNIGMGNGVYVKPSGKTETKHTVSAKKAEVISRDFGFDSAENAFSVLEQITSSIEVKEKRMTKAEAFASIDMDDILEKNVKKL